ncbi:MAG: hypothetical protein JWQ62_1607 [Lacunisphaera sp.]|nr:hypothetical protein [Lacunisphaera sp.]
MCSSFPPDKKYPSLTKQDCAQILRTFDAGLAILGGIRKRPTLVELQAKSVLAVLRKEIEEAARSAGSAD